MKLSSTIFNYARASGSGFFRLSVSHSGSKPEKHFLSSKLPKFSDFRSCHSEPYIQGQSPEAKIREYFYYIDHQGQLFLDDAKIKNFTSCFKDKQFIKFFINRIKNNNSGRYFPDFPYISLCGRERNFLRCDDLPTVFTQILYDQRRDNDPLLSYNHCERLLTTKFEPEKICMLPTTGRVYHPAERMPEGVGLLSDKLSILWTEEKRFIFEDGDSNPPTHFVWNKEALKLSNELIPVLKKIHAKNA